MRRLALGLAVILPVFFEFQELRSGGEGPSYFRLRGEPYKNAVMPAEAQLFSQESVGTARFELVSEAGTVCTPSCRTCFRYMII